MAKLGLIDSNKYIIFFSRPALLAESRGQHAAIKLRLRSTSGSGNIYKFDRLKSIRNITLDPVY